MSHYVPLPNVSFEPADLEAGLRSVTPSFLRKDESQEEEDLWTICLPDITYSQRATGWVVCFCLGCILQICSLGSLSRALLGHPGRFAMTYTLGNIVALAGTFFLAGPKKQVRKMADNSRANTSLIFVVSMFLTLLGLQAPHFFGRALVILALVFVQWASLAWYTLSYIPYGQRLTTTVLKKCFGWCCYL
mmetsp:Transcript_24229/g.45774  ORF Transcript_24229/g.45774 Transcript_24229/m.45774 type:complete len:190 (+) Transcript_24229:81-650(+)